MTKTLLTIAVIILIVTIIQPNACAATRPHYGGVVHVMLQAAPDVLELPQNATPTDYWDLARALSLIGDTLVKLDPQDRSQPALAVAWQSDAGARHWVFTLRRGVKFHDGSPASAPAIAQILGAMHPAWTVRASADSVSIETETALPSMLAELALPRNLLFKRNQNNVPVGTGPFVIADWRPASRLKLAANEESWAGRPFIDAVEIEFGKSLRDQAIALELAKADVIDGAPASANGSQRSLSSLPVELLALVFNPDAKAQDPRLREALALAIDRKPIQAVLLKGAGEPAASLLPNWMTGYSAAFDKQANPQRARTLLAESRQPALTLSYDPRDPQAQLIAERIALNAGEAGITVQVSLAGVADLRLVRSVLPSPDPATSLAEAARQLGLLAPAFSAPHANSAEDLYPAERSLLDGYRVIPLFHLPVASAYSSRLRHFEPGQSGELTGAVGASISAHSENLSVHPAANLLPDSLADCLANAWFEDSRPEAGPR